MSRVTRGAASVVECSLDADVQGRLVHEGHVVSFFGEQPTSRGKGRCCGSSSQEYPAVEVAIRHRRAAGPREFAWADRKCIGCSLAVGLDGAEVVEGFYGVDAETILYADVETVKRPASNRRTRDARSRG
jgi:hypothetical protein